MFRQRPILFAIFSLILASLACNAFAGGGQEPALELPPPIITAEAATAAAGGTEPVAGIAPTATLPGEATAVGADGQPVARVLVDLNIRSGPGVQYDRVGFLLQNESAPIIGRDPAGNWWKIVCPSRVTEVTECWISGGAQYSEAVNAAAVEVAAVPPTPTPRPTITPTPEPISPGTGSSVVAASGLLAYVDDSGLWAARLDLSSSPPAAGTPRQLAPGIDIDRVIISPDGQKVAYMGGPFENNYLAVVNADGSDNRILVRAADVDPGAGSGQATRLLAVQWLANSQSLAFNTTVVNLSGIGDAPQGDLWTVSLAGVVTNRLPAGSIGPVFDVAPGGQIISGDARRIVRADMSSEMPQTVLEYELVNTASEYIYYPQPRWTANGSRAFVAVPNREQWGPQASVTLWEIPAAGEPQPLATVPGNILFGGADWTANGSRLAYVVLPMSGGDNVAELTWARGDGGNAVAYAANREIALHGWNAGGDAFLYSAPSYYAVGRPGTAPTQVVVSERPLAMAWLTENTFLVVAGSPANWSVQSSTLSGESRLLVQFVAETAVFDAWTP